DPSVVWTVKINIEFVYNQNLSTYGETHKVNELSQQALNDIPLQDQEKLKISDGDNIYHVGESGTWNGAAGSIGNIGSNTGVGRSTRPNDLIHEALHFLGFDERYNRWDDSTPKRF